MEGVWQAFLGWQANRFTTLPNSIMFGDTLAYLKIGARTQARSRTGISYGRTIHVSVTTSA
jgi:hypothetical protein